MTKEEIEQKIGEFGPPWSVQNTAVSSQATAIALEHPRFTKVVFTESDEGSGKWQAEGSVREGPVFDRQVGDTDAVAGVISEAEKIRRKKDYEREELVKRCSADAAERRLALAGR